MSKFTVDGKQVVTDRHAGGFRVFVDDVLVHAYWPQSNLTMRSSSGTPHPAAWSKVREAMRAYDAKKEGGRELKRQRRAKKAEEVDAWGKS